MSEHETPETDDDDDNFLCVIRFKSFTCRMGSNEFDSFLQAIEEVCQQYAPDTEDYHFRAEVDGT